ncbi:MAG: DUF2194 domain-containing protein [Dethiobacter sp.]|nr:DUF2194 domain-containing protein [Dethiobacter sp.]
MYDMPTSLPVPAALQTYSQVVVLYSEEDEASRQLHNNVRTTFAMSRVNAGFINIADTQVPAMLNRMDNHSVVVITTEQMSLLSNYISLVNFVRQGGKVVFLIRSYFRPLDDLKGITENLSFIAHEEKGVYITGSLFPGKDGLGFEHMPHSMLDVTLRPEANVLAETLRGTPLIWTHPFGEGEVLYVNTTMMKSKIMRGLLLQCVAYLPEFFVTTIFNALVFNIDDFPAPIRFGRYENIYVEYFMDTPQFFKQVWWPDTYNFARRHQINLTGLTIATFNQDTKSPLEPINPLERSQLLYFGRRLSELGGELGIHGYNHQPLAMPGQMIFEKYGYTPWESPEVMEEGLRILRRAIEEMFGDIHVFSYVPPSNIISREGRIAVKNVFEDIRVFAGLYTGISELGVLEQEFGRDPYVPEVVSFPRLSSGYLFNDDVMWTIYNGIAHYGIVHHFIHPDDLLDPVRSGGYSWEEMDRQINAMFAEIRRRFPFLRAMTLAEAYRYFIHTEGLKVLTQKNSNVIKISYNQSGVPVYHLLRLRNNRVASVSGGKFG